MFIPRHIQTLFEILPNEIILGILFHVFKDNDENIRKAIPYLIPFLDDPGSQLKRRYKPEVNYKSYYDYSYEGYYHEWFNIDFYRPIRTRRLPMFIEEARSDYYTISNNYSYALISIPKNEKKKNSYKRSHTQSKKSYRTMRKQEMKFRNKQQRRMAKRSRR